MTTETTIQKEVNRLKDLFDVEYPLTDMGDQEKVILLRQHFEYLIEQLATARVDRDNAIELRSMDLKQHEVELARQKEMLGVITSKLVEHSTIARRQMEQMGDTISRIESNLGLT